jgi:hypothetical protein
LHINITIQSYFCTSFLDNYLGQKPIPAQKLDKTTESFSKILTRRY